MIYDIELCHKLNYRTRITWVTYIPLFLWVCTLFLWMKIDFRLNTKILLDLIVKYFAYQCLGIKSNFDGQRGYNSSSERSKIWKEMWNVYTEIGADVAEARKH